MKRTMYLLIIIVLSFIVMTACASKNDNDKTGNKGSTSSDGEVSLKIAVLPDDLETFEIGYEEFKKENPNINVEFETFPSQQYYEKIRMQLSGGAGYDVFAGLLDSLLDTEILEPLNDYIKDSDLDVTGYGSMYEVVSIDNEVLGLPYRKSNWMMYYNKDLFDENNVEYPTDDMTWAEFRELAKEMTSGTGTDKVFGAYLQQWPQTWYMQGVQAGASIIDKDLTPFEDALQYRLDLESDGSIMGWSEQVTTGAHYNEAFQKGNVAMSIIGDWHVAQLREAKEEGKIDFEWDVVPIPHPEGVEKNTTLALPVSLMMNSNTKHKDEAFKFIEFMTGEEGANIFASRGYITGYMDDTVKETYLGDGVSEPANLHYFLETKEYPEHPMLVGVKNIIVEEAFKQEGELALIGEQTVEEAITNIEKRIENEWASKYGE